MQRYLNHVSTSQHYIINYDNIFLKERCALELIFAEEDLFEISKNKNPLKITRYTVLDLPIFVLIWYSVKEMCNITTYK